MIFSFSLRIFIKNINKMKFVGLVTFLAVLSSVEGSNSWAGSNNYFIHAASASEQETWVNTLADWGAKVVRLWGNFHFQIYCVISKLL
jgi:Na+-transporting NADH:ubiquinone oxidoreductase subunit NqrE